MMRKDFLRGFAVLIAILFSMLILIVPSGRDLRQEAARIISAGVVENEYSLKSRYKVETFGGDIYFVVENVNRGSRNINQIVCLQIRTLSIIGSEVAVVTVNSRCPEISS